MLRFLKNNKLIIFMSSLVMTVFSAVVLSTIAWFSQSTAFTPTEVTSSIIASYFDPDSGNGLSAGSPLIITRPIHYYNMLYLQETNTYEIDTTNHKTFADAVLYFQFGKTNIDGNAGTGDETIYKFYEYDDYGVLQYHTVDGESVEGYSPILNMNYYSGSKALPPLGSSEHPFLGHINGHNLTISKLHINGEGYSDIGVFGYVGMNATVQNAYFESPVIDAGGNNSAATSGTNHSAHSTHTYIGYLAGHVYNASSTFTNVYVNNCELKNTTGNTTEMINTYGYFGKVDVPSSITSESASYAVETKASDIYSGINTNYSSGASSTLVTRSTQYGSNVSGTFSGALSTSSSNYTLNEFSNDTLPYSLSTIGWSGGDAVTKNVRYIDGNAYRRLSSSTTQITKPANEEAWQAYDDGDYLYWDSSANKWVYAIVESSTPSGSTEVNYYCFTISYQYNSTTYYWKYNNGSLGVDTTGPTNEGLNNSANYNYYFVFKPSEGSHGIDEFTSNSDSAQTYIYSPANQKYLHATADSSGTNAPTFTDSATTLFTVTGSPTTTITFTDNNSAGILCGTNKVYNRRDVQLQDVIRTAYIIGDPDTRTSISGYEYDLVTDVDDLAAGDTVIIVGDFNSTYYAMTSQAANNRSSVVSTVSNGVLTPGTGATKFLLYDGDPVTIDNQSVPTFRFYDNTAKTGYLYAASSSSNYLRTEEEPDDNGNADATISINASGYALIEFQGNNSHNTMCCNHNDASKILFSVYTSTSSYNTKPQLYKQVAIPGSPEDFTTATAHTFTSAQASSQNVTPYYLRVAPLNLDADNPANYSLTDFAVSDATFNFSNSRVSYTGSSSSYWQKVTDANQLVAESKYIIVHEGSSVALSTTQNNNNRGQYSVTISNGQISDVHANVQQITLKTSSAVSNCWDLYTGSGYLYAAGNSSNNYLRTANSASSDTCASITISSGDAIITYQGSYSNNILRHNSSSNIFSCYSSGQQAVQMYRYIPADAGENTYISDLIGNRYDPDRIDVVGPATFTSSYYTLNEASSVTATPTAGSTFYTTTYIHSGVSIIIDKTGSRDLGTLIFTYEESSDAVPYFLVNSGSQASLTADTVGARDVDSNGSDHVHSYLLNINSTSILSLGYCGIDSSGNIVALNSNDAVKYVIVLGASTSTHIQNIQYAFTNASGNVGNFGSVDYRTATYESNGTLSSASSAAQVSSSTISIYYDIRTTDQTFDITVAYDQTTHSYSITCTSSVATTINVFIYDNTTTVYVNDPNKLNPIITSANIIPIAAT